MKICMKENSWPWTSKEVNIVVIGEASSYKAVTGRSCSNETSFLLMEYEGKGDDLSLRDMAGLSCEDLN